MLAGDFGALTEMQRSYLETVQSNGLRLLKLINNLLDLAKIESKQLQVHRRPVRLAELAGGIIAGARPLAERKAVLLEVDGLAELPEIHVDPEAFEKILVNLLGNALKFTERGGAIRVDGVREGQGGVVYPSIGSIASKELGREDFDYDTEMRLIKLEQATLPKPEPEVTAVGMGGPSAAQSLFVKKGLGGKISGGQTVKLPTIPGEGGQLPSEQNDPSSTNPGHRSQLSAPVQAQFKHQQRQNAVMLKTMQSMMETMQVLTQRVLMTPSPITIGGATIQAPDPAPVTVRNSVSVPPPSTPLVIPPATVTVPEPVPARARTFEVTKRDPHGFAQEFRERFLPPEAV